MSDDSDRKLGPGSSILTLARVRLNSPQPPSTSEEAPAEPESLIADLEYWLGSAVTEYMNIRLLYRHSGFPKSKDLSVMEGVYKCQSRLETTATATIRLNNPRSAWSPSPTPSPVSDSLFTIIASHWGPIRANGVMGQIIESRSTPRKDGHGMTLRDETTEETTVPPGNTDADQPLHVPRRQTSLHKTSSEEYVDGERKTLTEMRSASSGRRPSYFVSRVNRFSGFPTPPSINGTGNPTPKHDTQLQQQLARKKEGQRTATGGADGLRNVASSSKGVTLEEKRGASFTKE